MRFSHQVGFLFCKRTVLILFLGFLIKHFVILSPRGWYRSGQENKYKFLMMLSNIFINFVSSPFTDWCVCLWSSNDEDADGSGWTYSSRFGLHLSAGPATGDLAIYQLHGFACQLVPSWFQRRGASDDWAALGDGPRLAKDRLYISGRSVCWLLRNKCCRRWGVFGGSEWWSLCFAGGAFSQYSFEFWWDEVWRVEIGVDIHFWWVEVFLSSI